MRLLIVFFILVSAVIAIFKDAHPEVTFIAQMWGVSWGALGRGFWHHSFMVYTGRALQKQLQ